MVLRNMTLCSSPDKYQHFTAGLCPPPEKPLAKNWQQCTKINHTVSYARRTNLNIYFRIYFISSYLIPNFIPKFLYDNNLRYINKQINNICALYMYYTRKQFFSRPTKCTVFLAPYFTETGNS